MAEFGLDRPLRRALIQAAYGVKFAFIAVKQKTTATTNEIRPMRDEQPGRDDRRRIYKWRFGREFVIGSEGTEQVGVCVGCCCCLVELYVEL